MNLSKIISISGMPGLYKVVAQGRNGVIVESLLDKKRMPAFASHKISALNDISIYTTGEDLALKDVLQKVFDKENGGPCIDSKSADPELQKYMESVLPEYDKERVRISDIRKLFSWYNIMQKAGGILDASEEAEEGDDKLLSELDKTKQQGKHIVDTGKQLKTSGAKAKATQSVRKTGAA
ncbi:MAG: hypothetical protein FD123_4047 [Bacteroidetes bacterium]|nr:MAG: hypothetical protein FD123_4047 [Bacteroidota bacterium]